jgi:hypothetical protein
MKPHRRRLAGSAEPRGGIAGAAKERQRRGKQMNLFDMEGK